MVYDNFFWPIFIFTNDRTGSDVGDYKFTVSDPAPLFILLLTIAAFFISKKRPGLTLFTLIGLWFIYNQGLWNDLMNTVTLVLLSSVISIIIGVPLGILMAKSSKAQSIIKPILDFMQTMPGFVYLIPAVAFFGIGMVPGYLPQSSLLCHQPFVLRI